MGVWSNRNPHSLPVGVQNGADTLEDDLTVSYKRTVTIYDSVIVFPGIYPNELKTNMQTKACTWRPIAVLSIIAQIWKQPRRPSVGEGLDKLWYTPTVE